MSLWIIVLALYLAIGVAYLLGELRYGFGGYSWAEMVGLVLFWPLVALIVVLAAYREWRLEHNRHEKSWHDHNGGEGQ